MCKYEMDQANIVEHTHTILSTDGRTDEQTSGICPYELRWNGG